MMIIMSVHQHHHHQHHHHQHHHGAYHHHLLRHRLYLFLYTFQVSRQARFEMQKMRGHDYHDDCW